MHLSRAAIIVGMAAVILMNGCSKGTTQVSGSPGVTVTFTFLGGAPATAAVQIGAGSFTPATVAGGTLTITLADSTTKFAVAYVCPPVTGATTLNREFIIEATPKDGTAFSVSCFGNPATGSATGSANATAVAGANDVLVRGSQGLGGNLGSSNGSFNVNLPTGKNDVALIAVDSSTNVLAVKILRAQTVPGAINSGNQIVFGTGDQVANQGLTVNNVPAGFVNPPAVAVDYITGNGTQFLLNNSSPTSYAVVPAASTQSGDFYSFEASSNDTATHNSAIGTTQNTTTGGGFVTLTLPTPWTFSGPAPAAFPTFTFNYTDFNALPVVAQQAEIQWNVTPTSINAITVTATASFQSGANTITIPNLTSLTGFIAPATSATTITWVADVFGGTFQNFSASPAPNGSISFVQNRGTFTQP